MIEIRDLAKSYRLGSTALPALRGATLTIEPGEALHDRIVMLIERLDEQGAEAGAGKDEFDGDGAPFGRPEPWQRCGCGAIRRPRPACRRSNDNG